MERPPTAPPPSLAHIVNPSYALTPPPHPMSHPVSGVPMHMHMLPPPPQFHPSHTHPMPHPHHAHPDHMHHSHSSHHHQHVPPLPALHPLPMPYYEPGKIARLEAELEKARAEIDALRLKLAEFEKERKADPPKVQSRYWTPVEHKRFLEALNKFGPKDVRAIANYVGSRNATQVRTHAQKYFLRVAREAKNGNALSAARKRSMSESDLARVGRAVSTPPGSPTRDGRDGRPPTPNSSSASVNSIRQAPRQISMPDARMTDSETVRTGQPPPLPPPLTKMDATMQAAKPPVPTGVTAGKPPRDGKMQDNTGINLLSLVASTRTLEADKIPDKTGR